MAGFCIMTGIARLPNLGPKSQQMLAGAGITTLDGQRRLGAARACVRTLPFRPGP